MSDSASKIDGVALDRDRMRVFLERAQPLLFADSDLTAETQQQLTSIAREVGLTSDEFSELLQDLQDRQVISPKDVVFIGDDEPGADIEFVDDKPHGASDEKVKDYLLRARGIIVQNGGINTTSRQALFELSEKMGLSDSQVHAAIVSLRDTIQRAQTRRPPEAESATPSEGPPPLPAKASDEVPPASEVVQDPMVAFREQAETILVEHGGFNPRSQVLLAAAAQSVGLGEGDYKAALEQLRGEGDETPPVADKNGDAPQAPPKKKVPAVPPAEAFLKWLKRELTRRKGQRLTRGQYKGWIRQAEHEFRLDRIYARHLIDDQIIAHGFVVAKSEQDEEEDPRVEKFLLQAAPILAEHRGINAKSRVLLNALAQQCDLSLEEMDRAIGAQETENEEEKRLKERIQSFRASLQGALQQLDNRLLNARLEAKLIEQGEAKFGIAPEQVKPIILEATTEAGVQRITHAQAEDHLLMIMEDQLGQRLFVPNEVRQRLLAEGNQWGLKADQVDDLIKQVVVQNRRASRTRRRIVTALVSTILLTATVIGLVLLNDSFGERNEDVAGGEGDVGNGTTSTGKAANQNSKTPKWWNKDILLGRHSGRSLKGLAQPLRAIASEKPEERASAYRTLVQSAAEPRNRRADVLLKLLSSCFARDPDETCAQAIADELARAVPEISRDKVSHTPIGFSVWATRVGAAAAGQKSIKPERVRLISSAFAKRVGITMATSGDQANRERKWVRTLLELVYRRMAAVASGQANWVSQYLPLVHDVANGYVDQGRRLSLEADVLSALMPHLKDDWSKLEPIMQDTIAAKNPQTVLKMVESFDRLPASDVKDFLARCFIQRVGNATQVNNMNELSDMVRKELGVSALPSTRWRILEEKSDEQIARVRPNAADVELLQDLINLNHVSTIGAAMSQGESAAARFEELADSEVPKITADPKTSKRRDPLASRGYNDPRAAQARGVHRIIDRLMSARRRRAILTSLIEGLSDQANTARDIDLAHAVRLAKFILAENSPEVRQSLVENLDPMVDWPTLRMAVADQLKDPPRLPLKDLGKIVSKFLKKEIVPHDSDNWRVSVRAALTESVLEQLGARKPTRSSSMYDRAQEILLEQLRDQAGILQMSGRELTNAKSPSAIWKLMIEKMLQRVSNGKLVADDRKWLGDLTHHMAAIEYLAGNELQGTVLMQSTWLRMLKIALMQNQTGRGTEAQDIIDKLNSQNRVAKSSLVQLRNGQLAIVRMWRLWHRPK